MGLLIQAWLQESLVSLCLSVSSLVVSLPRYGGDRVLSAYGWASCSLEFTLWRQFSEVPWYPHPHWLPDRHLLRYLRLSSSHRGQLLPCFHSPLLPAPQQRQQRRWGGRQWLMGKGEIDLIKHKYFITVAQNSTKHESKEWLWWWWGGGGEKALKVNAHQESSEHVKSKITHELSWESQTGLGNVRYAWLCEQV